MRWIWWQPWFLHWWRAWPTLRATTTWRRSIPLWRKESFFYYIWRACWIPPLFCRRCHWWRNSWCSWLSCSLQSRGALTSTLCKCRSKKSPLSFCVSSLSSRSYLPSSPGICLQASFTLASIFTTLLLFYTTNFFI